MIAIQSNKRIAIFHNALDNIGGAELVDLILARELNADIYTTNINKEKIRKLGFPTENIYSIGKVPTNAPFRQEAIYWRFRFLNVRKRFKKKYHYYIIGGDWAMPATINNKPHIWYVFSPIREIWDLYKYTKNKMPNQLSKLLFSIWVLTRRKINYQDSKKVNKLIAISRNVQNRIEKYLKRKSTIIYPPTETNLYKNKKSKNYWLSVNRLIDHKRVELQLKAFKNLPNEKLIIIGSYESSKHFERYANYIKKLKPKNVEIKSWVSQEELINLYSECKGFLTTSLDEDYGMTPIEAMASGKPVIAPNEGGYKETITNQTGILIDKITHNKIKEAIITINQKLAKNPKQFIKPCQEQAKRFDTQIFINKIKKEINYNDKNSNNPR
ncbi:mannosyl transferase [Candidatus Pacearchaeota archaeon]|nr:mannosyl transferase [Candidatus Pacearchaeota archaeon]|tara:strand:- start:584 stop:1735 length:1152 start_codon:yes stop_codon:yes gene_type:complete